jgi:hypothetical protein
VPTGCAPTVTGVAAVNLEPIFTRLRRPHARGSRRSIPSRTGHEQTSARPPDSCSVTSPAAAGRFTDRRGRDPLRDLAPVPALVATAVRVAGQGRVCRPVAAAEEQPDAAGLTRWGSLVAIPVPPTTRQLERPPVGASRHQMARLVAACVAHLCAAIDPTCEPVGRPVLARPRRRCDVRAGTRHLTPVVHDPPVQGQWPALWPPSMCRTSPVMNGDDSRNRTPSTTSPIWPTRPRGSSPVSES